MPDKDAEDNIRASVLRGLGIDDRGSQRPATGTGAAAPAVEIAVPDLAKKLVAEAEQYCRGVLDEYNAWVNGEVYGVVVYVLDRVTGQRIATRDDECWGYIGSEYTEDTLEDAILNTVIHLGAMVR